MIEYQNLKLEYKISYKNKSSTINLANLMQEYFSNTIPQNMKLIKNNIDNSNSPMHFYELLLKK